MQAYRIHNTIICADILEEAKDFFRVEIGGELPQAIEEVSLETEVMSPEGLATTIKTLINEELDRRNAWLRMGVPCELHWPFIATTL